MTRTIARHRKVSAPWNRTRFAPANFGPDAVDLLSIADYLAEAVARGSIDRAAATASVWMWADGEVATIEVAIFMANAHNRAPATCLLLDALRLGAREATRRTDLATLSG